MLAESLCMCLHVLLIVCGRVIFGFFFFNDTATTEIYTLSLHDALPIYRRLHRRVERHLREERQCEAQEAVRPRSEEHTSELQSRLHLVCRLLLEKKKQNKPQTLHPADTPARRAVPPSPPLSHTPHSNAE